MNHARIQKAPRGRRKSVPTNVSLDAALVAEARELGVNISQASSEGLEKAVKIARGEAWLEENRAALQWWNNYVEENGLPLAKYRLF
ncbi:type II toxin-antitoxin system CcdA family antitoxin [Sphingomonas lutea]|uniref:Type II toxin-antitoxin system CcdA family antitoxin n=2 Tax=Sphingomonas lutea TaxID=1045317 RepID=A0A7G9SKU0_9SPHN|nr:type II toxin-antitoxin system CcdA family antitoxin [Sphingomonas lutea]